MISPDLHLSPVSEMVFPHPAPGCCAIWMHGHGSRTKGGHIPAAAKPGCPKPLPKGAASSAGDVHPTWKRLWTTISDLQVDPKVWTKDLRGPSQTQSFNSLWRWPWKWQGHHWVKDRKEKTPHRLAFKSLWTSPRSARSFDLIWFYFFFSSLYSLDLNWTKTRGTVNWKVSVNSSSAQKEFQLKAISSCYPK